ncbi:MAG: RraA family protein [Bacteroidota bacterium]
MSILKLSGCLAAGFLLLCAATPTHAQVLSYDEVVFLTAEWEGERLEDGRPKVSDDILARMKNVSIEEAWGVIRRHGYHNQFAGNWKMIHEHETIVGRALTVQYMPNSPALAKRRLEQGHAEGRIGATNSWPIDMLQQGDVYVADAFGKIASGTLIGDNLGNAIFANSGTGVVFDGSLRDLEGLEQIEGFNAFVRDWHPSYIQEMMLGGINGVIRIGEAVVLPGDVVLAKRGGVLFIPAQFAQEAVETAELVKLRDSFGHQMLREGKYTPGQIDTKWTEAIERDFYAWLEINIDNLPVPRSRIQEMLDERNW